MDITSFHAGKCCHLVSENEASATRLFSSVCQCLIILIAVTRHQNTGEIRGYLYPYARYNALSGL